MTLPWISILTAMLTCGSLWPLISCERYSAHQSYGFLMTLEWVGIGHCEHPRGAVAVYSFHVIYQNALTKITERKIPTHGDETRT